MTLRYGNPRVDLNKVLRRFFETMKMKVRRYLLEQIHRDIKTVEKIQKHRTTSRDYFFWFSGLLGTHHFYLICLPALFWFKSGITVSYPNNQQEDLARVFSRGVIAILALGCYCTGVLKVTFTLYMHPRSIIS